MSKDAAYQFELLLHLKMFNTDIKKKLADMTRKGEAEISRIIDEAADESHSIHLRNYQRRGMEYVPFKENRVLQQIAHGYAQQTRQSFKNITRTVGFTTQDGFFLPWRDYFTDTLSKAAPRVALGATTYDEEIKRVVRTLAASGLKSETIIGPDGRPYQAGGVEYPYAAPWSVAASVRANVLTSIGALSGEIELFNGEALGMKHVEVSAHNQARPGHQVWQGRIYALNMSVEQLKKRYEDIREADAGARAMRRAERRRIRA
jgi:hypothetical protein